jgi:hypothetical protein
VNAQVPLAANNVRFMATMNAARKIMDTESFVNLVFTESSFNTSKLDTPTGTTRRCDEART